MKLLPELLVLPTATALAAIAGARFGVAEPPGADECGSDDFRNEKADRKSSCGKAPGRSGALSIICLLSGRAMARG